jgi:dipeptide transport system ATP-binding protein
MALLEIRNLSVVFQTANGPLRAVEGIDLTIEAGEVLCIVGESGSGKSMSMLAIMNLVGPTGRVTADVMKFNGMDLKTLSTNDRRRLIGRDLAMVFQDPKTSLNPCYSVGWQIAECLRIHNAVPSAKVRGRVLELMESVGIADPERRYGLYPHQLSGGMNQRIGIAMAIACNPKLLIADEPTSALDVTVQNQILKVIARLQRDHGMALAMITHDMGLVGRSTGRVQVMYAGCIVEEGRTDRVLTTPRHPYTAALLAARPELTGNERRLRTVSGVVPGADDRPAGCLFEPRCNRRQTICARVRPAPDRYPDGRASCHFPIGNAPTLQPAESL